MSTWSRKQSEQEGETNSLAVTNNTVTQYNVIHSLYSLYYSADVQRTKKCLKYSRMSAAHPSSGNHQMARRRAPKKPWSGPCPKHQPRLWWMRVSIKYVTLCMTNLPHPPSQTVTNQGPLPHVRHSMSPYHYPNLNFKIDVIMVVPLNARIHLIVIIQKLSLITLRNKRNFRHGWKIDKFKFD